MSDADKKLQALIMSILTVNKKSPRRIEMITKNCSDNVYYICLRGRNRTNKSIGVIIDSYDDLIRIRLEKKEMITRVEYLKVIIINERRLSTFLNVDNTNYVSLISKKQLWARLKHDLNTENGYLSQKSARLHRDNISKFM